MGRKVALIIGNSEYEDNRLAQLMTPRADVDDLASVLRDAEISSFDEVVTLRDEPAATVRRAIARFFAGKAHDDLLLLYFSGHGVLDDQGHLYLAVKDTERDLLRATAIPASFITSEMDQSRCRRQVLVLDCCHSGAFARGSKGALGASVGTAASFEGTGYGRVVLTASDATQFAWEGDRVIGDVQSSVFTRYLIQGLRSGEADLDADGWVTLDELYDYVYAQVVSDTPKQTPGKWSYKQQGEIVIARNPHLPGVKPAQLPVELQQVVQSPFAAVRASEHPAAEKVEAPAEPVTGPLPRTTIAWGVGWGIGGVIALAPIIWIILISTSAAAIVGIIVVMLIAWIGGRMLQRREPRITRQQAWMAALGWVLGWTSASVVLVFVAAMDRVAVAWFLPGAAVGGGTMLWYLLGLRASVWTCARVTVLCLLLLGFFGPWTQITACSSGAEPPPPETVTGVDALGTYRSLTMPLVAPVLLLFIATALRLGPRYVRNRDSVIWLERLAAVASPFGMVGLLQLAQKILWGLWVTAAGVCLALLNLLGERVASRRRRR